MIRSSELRMCKDAVWIYSNRMFGPYPIPLTPSFCFSQKPSQNWGIICQKIHQVNDSNWELKWAEIRRLKAFDWGQKQERRRQITEKLRSVFCTYRPTKLRWTGEDKLSKLSLAENLLEMRSTEANSALCVCCRLLCWHEIPSDLGIKIQLICRNINAMYGQFPNPRASKNEFLSEAGGRRLVHDMKCAFWEVDCSLRNRGQYFKNLRISLPEPNMHICVLFECAKYGQVGYPWKDLAKCSSDALSLYQ